MSDFNNFIFKRIHNLIGEYNLINEGELIAVALSGGKDSILTLHALKKYQKELDFDLVAISVDEGIENYRQDGVRIARSNAELLDIELIEKSFLKEESFTTDSIHSYFKSACIPCGVFRRNLLNKTAFEIGADKIATGHNADDEIQSFLMSFARGDLIKFSKFGPALNQIHPKLIPRIKPLWNTPENDILKWVDLNDIEIHTAVCPYSSQSLRGKIKKFLNEKELEYPDLKENIFKSFEDILDIEDTFKPQLNECAICGEPTSSEICKACEMRKEINSFND